jgi:hypothetical protein
MSCHQQQPIATSKRKFYEPLIFLQRKRPNPLIIIDMTTIYTFDISLRLIQFSIFLNNSEDTLQNFTNDVFIFEIMTLSTTSLC